MGITQEERAKTFIALSTTSYWPVLVEHLNDDRKNAVADLMNTESTRDEDMFLKGAIYAIDQLLALPAKGDEYLKSLTAGPDEG